MFTIINTLQTRKQSLVNMNKVVIKISQGTVVTQTTLGGLTAHPTVCQKL